MRKRIVVIFFVLVTLTVLVPSISGLSPKSSFSSFQSPLSAEVEQLQSDAVSKVEINWNSQTGRPSFVRAHIPVSAIGLTETANPGVAAFAFVNRYSNLLGVSDPAQELILVQTKADDLGMNHLTLNQMYQGVEVYGAQIKIHLNSDSQEFIAASSSFYPNISLPTVVPKVNLDQAIAIAMMALPDGVLNSKPRLVVYPNAQVVGGNAAKLSWMIELYDSAIPSRNVYIIDGIEGNILFTWNLLTTNNSSLLRVDLLSSSDQERSSDLECDPKIFYGVQHCDNNDTHILVIDLNDPHVRVQTALSSRSGVECNSVNHKGKDPSSNCFEPYPFETMQSFLTRYELNGAVAAINTDYFGGNGDHGSQGLAVRNGERLDGPNHGVTNDIAYTKPSLAFSPTNVPTIGIPGSQENINNNLEGTYYNVVGGAPIIIENSQLIGNDACDPGVYPYDTCSRQSQSAAGLTSDNRLVLITASQDASGIAEYLTTNFEVHTALKFDGGGSARMAWLDRNGQIQTFGGTGEDRPVAEALIIFSDPISSNRLTYDAENGYDLPGILVRAEGDPPTGDQDVDDAHDFAGDTYDYFFNTHNRDSYDDAGASLISTANYGVAFNNAYWDGTQMVYGDGFAVNDVVAHELTHAVTEHSANLEYKWQSGALNESFSDMFGAMVDRDDWLIGEDLPPEALGGQEAIRDLADPSRFGQPDHTDGWVATCSDNQGVHTNSGITNKAYYNIATAIGKDKAELIFYRALTTYLFSNSSLEDARSAAIQSTQDLYGMGSTEETTVNDGFSAVGLDGNFTPPTNSCSCAATTALSDKTVFSNRITSLQIAATLYRLRDEFSSTKAGGHYRELYEQHTGRISSLLLANAALRAKGGFILQLTSPGLAALVNGQGSDEIVTQEIVDETITFLQDLAIEDRANGGGELADAIEHEISRIDWNHLVGMTFDEAFEYINTQLDIYRLYLPIVAR